MTHPPIDSQITFLYTPDLAHTAHFYEDIMGLQLKLDQGACRIYQSSLNSYLGFCQRADTFPSSVESSPPPVVLTIVTSNVDEWHQYLLERNIRLEEPPATNHDYNIYHFFLRDPNGYLLEIQQFLHPF
jgi:catechol 2,3-dioxygenase-like lactoylglutathione lyase family enzyme